MRKTKIKKLISPVVLMFVVLLTPVFTLAQSVSETNQSVSHDFPQVIISQIILDDFVTQAGGKITGKFILQNQGSQAIADLRYKTRLFEKPLGDAGGGIIDNTPRTAIDTQISQEIISVNYLEEKAIKFSYDVPRNLISGEHLFMIEVSQSSGKMLSWETVKVTINNASGKYISVKDTAVIFNKQKYSAMEGINVGLDENIQAYLGFNNAINVSNVKLQTVVYYRNPLLNKIFEETKDLTIKNGKNEVIFDLPKLYRAGGSYLAVVKILDSAGSDVISSEAEFRWVIKGISAKILGVTFDSLSQNNDVKILPFLINYAGPADNSSAGQGVVRVDVKNESVILASAQKDIALEGVNNANINIDMSKMKNVLENNANLVADIKIEKDGKILDEYSLKINPDILKQFLIVSNNVATPAGFLSELNIKNALYGIFLVIFATTLIVVLVVIRKKRNHITFLTMLFVLLSAGILLYNLGDKILKNGKANASGAFVTDYGKFSKLNVYYDGMKIRASGDTNGANLHLYFTDERVDFSRAPSSNFTRDCEFHTIMSKVRHIHLPNSGHNKNFNLTNPIPKNSKRGDPFQGNKRYVYAVSDNGNMCYTGGCHCNYVNSIAHVELPAPSLAVQDFFFYGGPMEPAAYTLGWDFPTLNQSYVPGNNIRFKGTLGSMTCNNAVSNLFANKMRFAVSQNDLNYKTKLVEYEFGSAKVVDPNSLSSSNFIILPQVANFDGSYYDFTLTNAFPGVGKSGTNPGQFLSGQLKTYTLAYTYDNNISIIASIPVNYTAPNNPPVRPSISGETEVPINTLKLYTASSKDPDGDQIRYGFDWDMNNSIDQWAPSSGYVNSGTSQSINRSWNSIGSKKFQVLAEDVKKAKSTWSSYDVTVTTFNNKPLAPVISGKTTVSINASEQYTASSTDPDGDQIRYGFDWDMNNSIDQWAPSSGYVNSGTSQSINRSWNSIGSKKFQVLAEDVKKAESTWSSYNVTVTTCQPTYSCQKTTPTCSGICDKSIAGNAWCVDMKCNTGTDPSKCSNCVSETIQCPPCSTSWKEVAP